MTYVTDKQGRSQPFSYAGASFQFSFQFSLFLTIFPDFPVFVADFFKMSSHPRAVFPPPLWLRPCKQVYVFSLCHYSYYCFESINVPLSIKTKSASNYHDVKMSILVLIVGIGKRSHDLLLFQLLADVTHKFYVSLAIEAARCFKLVSMI